VKPAGELVAERPAAVHCAELLGRAPPPVALLPLLQRLGERLARLLPVALAPWHGGIPPIVTCTQPDECEAAQLTGLIGPLAANCLLGAGPQAAPLLASIEAAAVFRLVDRAYGGRGAVPDPLPAEFPLSADLLIGKLEALLAVRLAQALGADQEGAVRPLRRDSSLAALAPFPPATGLATIRLTIAEEGDDGSWDLTLAFPLTTLEALFGHGERPTRSQSTPHSADPAGEPFGGMPLPLTAVLVEMQVPLATISALDIGSVLPVAVARKVPLRIGGKTIAHGTVGTLDDCAALQLSELA
jgi:flagellar motor switch protein FliM